VCFSLSLYLSLSLSLSLSLPLSLSLSCSDISGNIYSGNGKSVLPSQQHTMPTHPHTQNNAGGE
jgi:hypothetical protein